MALPVNKNWLLLAGALGLGALAFYMSNKSISDKLLQIELEATQGKKQVEVIVADRDMAPGEVLTEAVLSQRKIPAEFVNDTTVRPDTYSAILDQSLVVGVKRGEPILTSYTASRGGSIFSGTVKKGRRALTIETDDTNSFSQMLRPGDRVDIIYTAKPPVGAQSADADVTFPLMSNIEIVATGPVTKQGAGRGEVAKGFAHVTLDLSPEEANQLIAARTVGRVNVVLRATAEAGRNPAGTTTLNSILAGVLGAPTRGDPLSSARLVQVIIGGVGSGSKTGGASVSEQNTLAAAATAALQKMREVESGANQLPARAQVVPTNNNNPKPAVGSEKLDKK